MKRIAEMNVEELHNPAVVNDASSSVDNSKKDDGVLLLPHEVEKIIDDINKDEIKKDIDVNDEETLPVTNTDQSVSVSNSTDHHDLPATYENDTSSKLEKA